MTRCAGRTRSCAAVVALVAVLAACSSDDEEPTARPSAPASSATPSPSGTTTAPAASAAATRSPAAAPSSPGAPDPVATGGAAPALPTVPARPVRTLAPVPLTSPAPAEGGIVVSLADTASVTTAGRGPGESSGESATAFTLRVDNRGSAPLDLATATVTVYTGPERTPARQSEGPPARPLQGTVPPGGSAQGVYVFVIPPAGRSDVELTVDFSVEQPIVVLSGPLP